MAEIKLLIYFLHVYIIILYRRIRNVLGNSDILSFFFSISIK